MAADDSKALAGRRAAEIDLAYRAILDGEPLPVATDAQATSRAIAERILEASSAEQVLQQQELPAWRDLLDVPVEVRGFRLNPSGYEQGSSVYAVVDLTRLDTGESIGVSCGGQNVLVQLVKLLELDALPAKVKLTGKRTGEGYQALWLQAA